MNTFSLLGGKQIFHAHAQYPFVIFKMARKNFKWEDAHIEQLIDSMITYKVEMSFKGLDFDADKPAMYNVLRIPMAELNADSDVALHAFGPDLLGTIRHHDLLGTFLLKN